MYKRYELTDNTIEWKGRILHRIRALMDIHYRDAEDPECDIFIKSGDIGGYVEKESNLAQGEFESSWICGDGKVYDNAVVCQHSIVENSEVYGNAIVAEQSWIGDGAQVYENAIILSSLVFGNQKIYGTARVHNSSLMDSILSSIYGDSFIESSRINGYCRVYDNAQIYYAEISNCDIYGDVKIIFPEQEKDHYYQTIENKRIFKDTIIKGDD